MKIYLRNLLLTLTLIFSSAITAQRLYWVGGSGNFNDPMHWSYESNGQGGAKTPGISDDVYFDENSFRGASVINIIGGASCHDLIFEDNTPSVILNGTQNEKLIISGNAAFNSYINNQFLGDVWFTSSQQNNSLKVGFASFIGNVYFDGGGLWNINSLFNVDKQKTLTVKSGNVVVANKAISVGNITCNANANLTLSNSKLVILNKLIAYSPQQIQGVQGAMLLFDYSINSTSFSNIATQNISNLKTASTVTVSNIIPCTCNGFCDGQATLSGIAGGTPPYTIFWSGGTSSQTYSTSSASITCTGLCGSTYNILISDDNGATISFLSNITIPQPSPINVAPITTTKPLCSSSCDGKFKYVVVGGNPTYTVTWTPGPITHTNIAASTNDSIFNLCSGTYTANIVDTKGCLLSPAFSVNLNAPLAISPNGSVKAPLCAGVCNGMAWVVPTGGTPFAANQSNGIKYTTVWDGTPALSNDTLYSLCANTTHTCVVTDKNGCTATYIVTVPAAPLPITFVKNPASGILNINCQNQCNGVLAVTSVAGGTTPYTFSWTPSAGTVTSTTNSTTYSSLCAGNYTCSITDLNGCNVQASYTVIAPPALTHTLTVINPKCNGQTSGSIKDSVAGGTPAAIAPQYTFSWTPIGTITGTTSSSTNSNLGPGTYSVVATDSKGCKDTARATLINPPAITATMTPTNPTCFGLTNGQICVAASGGTGSVYTYTWNPVEPATNCISGLGAGGYTVTVADSNHCTKIVSTTLVAPPQINISVVKVNPTCSNLCNGTATVTASGGSGAGYTYSWSCAPGNTTNVLSGQCGGTTCTVTVTDGNGCSQSKVINFINPNPLSVSISATPLVCANQCNSQITTNVIGGTPTYTYTWSGSGVTPGTPNQTNMCAGSYSVLVTDSNNCTVAASVNVSAPNPLVVTATPTDPSCFGSCDGSIIASISGGAIPYAYGWNPSIIPVTLTPNNLCSGTYTLNVIDANGCTATQVVTLTNPTPITATVTSTNVTCAGSCNGTATVSASGGTTPYLYSWDGATYTAGTNTINLCAGTHTLQVKDSKGCTGAAVIYNITQPQALTASVSNITKSCLNICNGTATASASGGSGPGTYGYSWDNAAGPFTGVTNINTLCIGTHTLYVQDANGCIASTVFNVQVIINVNILANSISVSCHNVCDGSASATASGGSGPYTFSWTPAPNPVPNCTNVNSCTANNLCPGPYTVLVTDQTGCASKDSIIILNPPILTASVSVVNATCFGTCNGSATITAAGGTAPYTEQWSNNGIIGPNPTGLCPGTYTATVTDNRGCTVSNPVTINSSPQFTVIPTVSSPTACVTSTGSISLAISGGSGTYTVNWNTGSTANPLTGIAAGIYTATITDGNGCDTVLTIGVTDPTGPTTNVVINQNASCFGSCDGSATVSGTGVAPINITWSGGGPSGLSPVTDAALCGTSPLPNNYPVQVQDGNGCISIANVAISEPTKILDNAVITPLTCSSGNTGSITLTPSGGSGSGYTFTLDGVASGNPMLNVSAGSHTVVITDGTGCSSTYVYNINSPSAINITVTKTNELCAGACNGTAQASVTGGTAAYTYTWTNSGGVVSNNPNVAGMCPGTYTLNVTDSKNCTAQVTVIINAANAIIPNLVQQNNNCKYRLYRSGYCYTYRWIGWRIYL